MGLQYAKENTVCSFFNLHVRKLSNGPMNLPRCQFCTFSDANSIMSYTVSHMLLIWLLFCSFDVIHSVFVIEKRFFMKLTTEGSCDCCLVLGRGVIVCRDSRHVTISKAKRHVDINFQDIDTKKIPSEIHM